MEKIKFVMTDTGAPITALCRQALEAKGVAVTVCEKNGGRALAALVEQRPQAVLLDAFMPEMDAITVKQRYDAQDTRGARTTFFVTGAFQSEEVEQELLDNGFEIFEQQHYKRNFEKLGTLEIVPGVYSVAEYDIFMIYLVNEEGYIAWSFQPMEDYDSLFSMMGMLCLDLDGDGMKDLVIQARFSYEGPNEELVVDTRCLIYYQRTDGFVEDTEFEKLYQFTEKDRLKDDIVVKIRDFWGWEVEKE